MKKAPVVLIFPSILFLIIALYGILAAFYESVGAGNWTISHYETLFSQPVFWRSLGASAAISLVATILSLLLGLSIVRSCFGFMESLSGKLVVWLPMLFPHFVWGYFVLLLLGQSGILAQFLDHLGIIQDLSAFPLLVQDTYGIGIIITYVWKETPFVILMLLPGYISRGRSLKEAVWMLGGGKWESFKIAEWPWVYPILTESGLILFSFILTAFEVPYLLGVTSKQTISVLVYQWFYSGNWEELPLAYAALSFLSLSLGMISWVLYRTTHQREWMKVKVTNEKGRA